MPKVQKPIVNILKKKLEIESERFGEGAFKSGEIVNYGALGRTILRFCNIYLIEILGDGLKLLKSKLGRKAKRNWKIIFKKNSEKKESSTDDNCIFKYEIKNHVTTDIKSLQRLFGQEVGLKEGNEEIKESKYQRY